MEALLDELRRESSISLGLWPGATTIRVAEGGVNVADFEIRTTWDRMATDELIIGNGSAALFATLPIRKNRTWAPRRWNPGADFQQCGDFPL